MKTGRPKKHFETETKETIVGLCDLGNGKWRITEGPHKGKRFNEKNPYLAVQRYRAIVGAEPTLTIAISSEPADRPVDALDSQSPDAARDAFAAAIDSEIDDEGNVVFVQKVKHAKIWAWVRNEIIRDRVNAAKMLGIAAIANLDLNELPKPSLVIADLIAAYTARNPASEKAKREAVHVLDRLVRHAAAKTLADLTIESLTAWRDEIERTVESGSTKEAYYSRVKTIIGFGLKLGMDTAQITDFLDRAKVLWTATPKAQVDPQPISKTNFHRLLTAGNGSWRPWLLCGLNLCMHLDEVCELKWEEIDLDKGTYASIRRKTAAKRIPRAATLWPETVAALKSVPRRGGSPFVFTSTHGTRYNRNTRGNDFAELRTAAKLSDDVTFDAMRDGAYTAACRGGVDDRLARLLAGHKAAGLQDNYVLRNPAIVKPACDAVYAAYGPFPQ